MTIIAEPTEEFPYQIRSFPAKSAADGVEPASAKWTEAVAFGFHAGAPEDLDIEKSLTSEEKDGRIHTGAYAASALDGAWDADYPVATYASYRKTVNVGAGKLLPAHLISAVTVRPTHRRRGLLRTIITADLRRAKADGLAIAALTASEATIYGRFGFGAATHAATIEVDSSHGFALKSAQPGRGIVEIAEPGVLRELEPRIFNRVHAGTFGSIGRQDSYRYRVSGYWNYGKPGRDRTVRAALYYGQDGKCEGYVSYRVLETETPATLKVIDLLAADHAAHLALWQFLGSVDLVQRIRREGVPMADPLPWALADKRRYQVTEVEDHLWLRILDTTAALQARHYWLDGTVTLKVMDALGFAGGVYRLHTLDGVGTVTELPASEPADLELGAAELAQLYLAGVSAQTLLAAGTVGELRTGGAAAVDAVFAAPVPAHSLTDF
ncbi:GNAT family N-acetyltransferase [Paeniglutamicibacter antarcticus]|uniref:GNAT family N-acetyltransferase n=1 Tax=Arthrobacter terrae TaxID=2935737 RepID=A0A931CTL3_9MICC|nr:GNAT family N-acetyltransferase [Arthrobacter terrae]MBG0741184.1 GNAT family N-acetyltransferase [Arthrobacter terrae]